MSLGNKILDLRKKKGLSQEQLGEMVDVTRQTISNWELGETSPNPEQLKLLSKVLNTSIDELLDNEIKSVLEEKVNNTEKLAGIIIKILKVIGIGLIVFIIIDIISFILFCVNNNSIRKVEVQEIEMQCNTNDKEYIINIGSDGYFKCSNCSKDLQKDLKDNYVNYEDLTKSKDDIEKYFENNNGSCN